MLGLHQIKHMGEIKICGLHASREVVPEGDRLDRSRGSDTRFQSQYMGPLGRKFDLRDPPIAVGLFLPIRIDLRIIQVDRQEAGSIMPLAISLTVSPITIPSSVGDRTSGPIWHPNDINRKATDSAVPTHFMVRCSFTGQPECQADPALCIGPPTIWRQLQVL